MGGDSVAASQLRAFIERAERMNEEKAAINEDLKEIFAEARGNGFDVKVMKAIISDRAKDPDKKSEFDEIYDLYASALGMRIATRAGAHEDDDQEDDVVVSDTIDRDGNRLRVSVDPRIAAILARTESTTKNPSVPAGFDPEMGEFGTTPEITEQQPAPAARDLTVPQALTGQVANHTPEMANELPPPSRGIGGEDDLREPVATGQGQIAQEGDAPLEAAANANGEGMAGHAAHLSTDTEDPTRTPAGVVVTKENGVTGGESAATIIYAEPGEVVMENCPPEPVKRHAYSAAWAEVGQDITKLRADVHAQFGGVRDPITKIGCEILDGWARYNISRSMLIDYPVVQYGGADPLMDCIVWNLLSRELSLGQKKLMAGRLTKLEPARADDIYSMFGLAEAQEAAQ